MVEIVRTNDLVLVGFLQSLLENANIPVLVADAHMSALEGMIGVFPAPDPGARRSSGAGPPPDRRCRARRRIASCLRSPRICCSAGAFACTSPPRVTAPGPMRCCSAASAPVRPGDVVMDVGAATGAVGLMVADRQREARFVFVERDPALAELCRRNCRDNDVPGEVAVADVLDKASRLAAGLRSESADHRRSPTRPSWKRGRRGSRPDTGRAAAHALPAGGLGSWLKACTGLLKPKGTAGPDPSCGPGPAECLQSLETWLGSLAIRFVHPDADRPAIRVLLSGVKGSRAPLSDPAAAGPERPRRALHASGRGPAPGRGDPPMKEGASTAPSFSSIAVAGSADRAADLDRAAHPAVAVPGPPGLDPAAAARADRAITPVGDVHNRDVRNRGARTGRARPGQGGHSGIPPPGHGSHSRDNKAGQRPAAPRGRRSQGPQNQEDRRRAYAFFLSHLRRWAGSIRRHDELFSMVRV